MTRAALLIALLLGANAPAQATAQEALREFVRSTRSGSTTFTQVVVGKTGKSATPASGSFHFQRPGKFRWVYDKPYEQWIVADGERLWIYDRDLNQVTMRKQDGTLGQSPAAILSGNDDLAKNFELSEAGREGDIEWLLAVPRAKDTTFESVRIGMRAEGGVAVLAVMELKDSFGQTSVLRFGRIERNPKLAPDLFNFTPPKGADVIGGQK